VEPSSKQAEYFFTSRVAAQPSLRAKGLRNGQATLAPSITEGAFKSANYGGRSIEVWLLIG